MATKPDFAQKLLHDLRLRKERMAATQNNSMVRGSYGNAGQAYKGSRQIKALDSVGSRSGNSFGGTRSGSRSYIIEDSSNQIVPYGKGAANAAQVGELSSALAFAFGNGTKLGYKMDGSGNIQMLNFLQHIGRRSMDKGAVEIRSNFGKSSSSGHFPTYSHIHINEVSKGVEKINQILRACSKGVNFDRYSIEVGRELLKGAMDLEESLRMLVNMQEASDYMISTQRKNKIKLLEDDEEDESESKKLTDLKRLDRPRFSFDKPSRTSNRTKETAKNGIKQQFMALTYAEETPRSQAKQARSSSNISSHTRSASYLSDYGTLSTYLEPKSPPISSNSKLEKGRISNVIAKLMGLDELPPKGDLKTTEKEMSSKRKESVVSKKHGVSDHSNPQQTENRPHISTQKNMASSTFGQKSERIQANPNGSSKVVIYEESFPKQDTGIAARTDAESVSKIVTIIMDNQQSRVNHPNEVAGYRKVLQEKRKEEINKADKENDVTQKGECKDLLMNNELQLKAPERRKVSEDNASENTVQTGKKNAGSHLQRKKQKHQYGHEQQQLRVPKKFDHVQETRKKQVPRQKLQAREPKGNRDESVVVSKPKISGKGLPKKQLDANLAPAGKKKLMKHVDVKPKGPTKSKDVAHAICETYMQEPQPQEKTNHMKINANQNNKKIDAVATRRNGTLDHTLGPLDAHAPVPLEMKHQKDEKASSNRLAKEEGETQSKVTEARITEFSEMEEGSQPTNVVEQFNITGEGITFENSDENEYQGLEAPKYLIFSDSPSNIAAEEHRVPDDEWAFIPTDDLQLEPFEPLSTPYRGEDEGSTKSIRKTNDELKKIPSAGPAELLTEAEKQLKEILIKGQLFLNTAEALFKLNIPVSILHGSDHNDQDSETKLTLDCAYELLKKKGKRQELSIYPFKDKSIFYVKIKSFDDLIKQLNKDFDLLKFSDGKTGEECDTAGYLHKMLENDIQNRKPDVNSMWDFSWNEKTSAFLEKDDIVRDLENLMLNGLLDEITSELLHIEASA